ncbi:MAG: penicillin-binding transpeptidase domain-containing protein, partial [Candidatus Paceibacterota bacterium]
MFWKRRKTYKDHDLSPEDVLIDAHNMPHFNEHQFEGRMAGRIPSRRGYALIALFALIALVFGGQLYSLQVLRGPALASQSAENHLDHHTLFTDRGIIYDRTGRELAWNTPQEDDFNHREYIDAAGFGHVLGYISYPKRDADGNYYDTSYAGVAGAEAAFNGALEGEQGVKIIERDAHMDVLSENTITDPVDGEDISLSIDAALQEAMHGYIRDIAERVGFVGGAGVIMNVNTGEILTLTNYPEYSPQVLVDGDDEEMIVSYQGGNTPFLNRATQGLYTPGSIVKPYVALGVLSEDIINPRDRIRSTGEIRVENPYEEGEYSVFKDWKAHGLVDLVDALAVSSNVYFYVVGGGHNGQEGLGISRLVRYFDAFDIGTPTGFILNESSGTIPSPAWKSDTFNGEPWRLGDTYHTAIGQYGFQVTPLQMTRAMSGIVHEGEMITPHLRAGEQERLRDVDVNIESEAYGWVKRGLRESVLRGTARGLNVPYINIAAKTGTAEVGNEREKV